MQIKDLKGIGPEFAAILWAEGLAASVEPADIIEEILVRDIAYLVWEALRLRRMKANLSSAGMIAGVKRILRQIDPRLSIVLLAERWAVREPDAVAQFDRLLAEAGLTMDSVAVEAFAGRLDEIERVDRMIAMAEARRSVALRDIERHRETFAGRMREAVE